MDKRRQLLESYSALTLKGLGTDEFVAAVEALKADAAKAGAHDVEHFFAGMAASERDECEEAVACFDAALTINPDFPQALRSRAFCVGKLGRREEELKLYDAVDERYGKSADPLVLEQVATALVNKGAVLGKSGKPAEAIAVCDEVAKRFGDAKEPGIIEDVATALVNKGVALGESGKPSEANAVYDEVAKRFGDAKEPGIMEQVARALVNKGWALGKSGKPAEAISVYDEVAKRFGNSKEPGIIKQVATALAGKGLALGRSDKFAEAITVYDEVAKRFGDAKDPGIVEEVARALAGRGLALEQSGKPAEAAAVYEELITRFPAREEGGIARIVSLVRGFRAALPPFAGKRARGGAEGEKLVPPDAEKPEEYANILRGALASTLDEYAREAESKGFFDKMKAREARFMRFLESGRSFDAGRSILFVLREWNSFTPAIPDEQEADRGGGYFIHHRGQGIVIDPGYDFIENFERAGGRIADIDHIVLTHAHGDHTAEFESLLVLLHEFNSRREKEGAPGARKKVKLYLSQSAHRKFAGLFSLKDRDCVGEVVTLNKGSREHPQRVAVAPGITMTVLCAYHPDVLSDDCAVGVGFDISCGDGPKAVSRKILFTGDTGLFPQVRGTDGELIDNRVVVSKDDALYARYPEDFGPGSAIDLAVVHIGSIRDSEFRMPDLGSDMGEKFFYPHHLGILGVTLLLSQLKPRAAVISEFGEELKDIKWDIVKIIDERLEALGLWKGRHLVPGDLTVVYDIAAGKFLCHDCCAFKDVADLHVRKESDFGPRPHAHNKHKRTYLFASPAADDVSGKLEDYYNRLADRALDYFAPPPPAR